MDALNNPGREYSDPFDPLRQVPRCRISPCTLPPNRRWSLGLKSGSSLRLSHAMDIVDLICLLIREYSGYRSTTRVVHSNPCIYSSRLKRSNVHVLADYQNLGKTIQKIKNKNRFTGCSDVLLRPVNSSDDTGSWVTCRGVPSPCWDSVVKSCCLGDASPERLKAEK